jgi:hypothetical protein
MKAIAVSRNTSWLHNYVSRFSKQHYGKVGSWGQFRGGPGSQWAFNECQGEVKLTVEFSEPRHSHRTHTLSLLFMPMENSVQFQIYALDFVPARVFTSAVTLINMCGGQSKHSNV